MRFIWTVMAAVLAFGAPMPQATVLKPRVSVITWNTYFIVRLFDEPCSKEALEVTGAQDGEFYRRASVMYFSDHKVYDACWLTLISSGSVTVYVVNRNEFEFDLSRFRPEHKA